LTFSSAEFSNPISIKETRKDIIKSNHRRRRKREVRDETERLPTGEICVHRAPDELPATDARALRTVPSTLLERVVFNLRTRVFPKGTTDFPAC